MAGDAVPTAPAGFHEGVLAQHRGPALQDVDRGAGGAAGVHAEHAGGIAVVGQKGARVGPQV